MSTGNLIDNTTKWSGAFELDKQTGTLLTLGTTNTLVKKPIELSISAQLASPSFDGGALNNKVATAVFTNMTTSSTDTSGVAIQAAGAAGRDAVLYNGAVNGWVIASDNASASAAVSTENWTGTTYYATGVDLKRGKNFSVSVPNGALSSTFNFAVDANDNSEFIALEPDPYPRLGIPITITNHINPATGEWERPADWPDIDALAAQIVGDQDCLYLTYDLRKTPGYGWIGLYAKTADSSAWTATRGHVEDGAFVADETISTASDNYLRRALNDSEGDVQLWRVTSTGHITEIGFCPNTTTNAQNYQNNIQPCVQRAGTLPWCARWAGTIGTSQDYKCGGTVWMERDAILPGKLAVVKAMSSCWQNCYSLQSLDIGDWDTSGWAVTSLNSCWQNCYSLQSLDIGDWDTSGWAVTSLNYCWNSCYSLQSLDIGEWDTSGWAVTTLASCWYSCYSLQSLDIGDWDTSGWAVTTLASCWYSCYSLQSLDIGDWDTSGWAVTTLASCWYSCYSLQSLDIGDWDTSGWAVTTLASCWNSCYSLQSLDIGEWDTSGWAVTTLAYCWYSCYSLQSLDIGDWDTSGWAVTTLYCCWNSCYSLQSLDIGDWDTSNWAVTTLQNCWNSCYSLQSLDISEWDTSGWAVTTLQNCWNSCYSLQSLDISDWDTSGWAVTDSRSMFNNCQAMQSLKFPSGLFSNSTNNNYSPNLPSLYDFGGYVLYADHSYNNALMLTPTSLVNIISKLPTVTTTKTLTLGQTNKLKLTAEQIAVATQKGWTVA